MAETEVKVDCPECGHPVGLKDNGTKLKVHKVAGERCEGSESAVTQEFPPEGLDKGDPYSILDSDQGAADNETDGNDPETPTEPETGTQGIAKSSVPTFVHIVDVHYLCPYLGDQAWHHENAKMAARVAQAAGHVLAGGEAQHVGSEVVGDRALVRYEINVK